MKIANYKTYSNKINKGCVKKNKNGNKSIQKLLEKMKLLKKK